MAKIIGMNDNGTPKPQPQKVTLDQTTAVTCPECEGEVFFAGVKFRKVSRLLTGAPQDQLSPIEVYTCGGCGEVLQELLPPELKN